MPTHLHLAPAPVADDQKPRPDSPISVVLADDHHAVRRNLRVLLNAEDGIEVIREATDLDAVIHHVSACRPHVLILDLHLPNGSALAVIDLLRRQIPETRIVVLTMEPSPAFARRALAAGALGYVLKDQADQDLIRAVRCAARGESYVSPQIAVGLAAMDATEMDGLTERETEVLRLTALGYTATEIAGRLHVSQRTVESHRATVHKKLGLRTRADLVKYALRNDLVGTEVGS